MEKETLEEAYLNQLIDEANNEFTLDRKIAKEVAMKFAQWQQERMPIDILQRIILFGDASPELMETSFVEIYDKSKRWFEQFKKK